MLPKVTGTLPIVNIQSFKSIRVTGDPEIELRVTAIYGHESQNAANTPNVTGTLPRVTLQRFKSIRVTRDPWETQKEDRFDFNQIQKEGKIEYCP